MGLPATHIEPETDNKKVIQKALMAPLPSMRALLDNNFHYFLQYFWDTYSQDDYVDNWHVGYLCNKVQSYAERVADKETKKSDLLINIPPGMTKTAILSIFFPVWCWTRWYWMRFITSSHSSELALESADYSREIIRSDKFQQLYPELFIKEDKSGKTNYRIVKKVWVRKGFSPQHHTGGMRKSTSVGAKVTGFHAHIIIADDLIDPHGAISEAKLKEANRHLDQTLSTRKTDKKVSVVMMIAQRLAQDDPPGHMLEKNKKVEHICMPGTLEGYEEQVNPPELKKHYVDGLLDVNRLGPEELNDLEADLGQYAYAGQIGQNPTPAGGGMFKTDKFQKIYTLEGIAITKKVRYWDKAGTKDGGAYTAGVLMGITQDDQYIVLDVKRGQLGADEREKLILNTAKADGHNVTIGVEQEPGSGGKESAEGTVKRLKGYTVITDRPVGDKIYRADPLSTQVNWGNVLLLVGEWVDRYVEEFKLFPLGKYKDQVDASGGAFAVLTGRLKKKARALGGKRSEQSAGKKRRFSKIRR